MFSCCANAVVICLFVYTVGETTRWRNDRLPFRPYDDNIEPIASAEEIVEYEETVAQEGEENSLQQRFNANVEVTVIFTVLTIVVCELRRCECGNCSLDLLVKPEECRCCMEIQQCRNKMFEYEDGKNEKCILEHPVVFFHIEGTEPCLRRRVVPFMWYDRSKHSAEK